MKRSMKRLVAVIVMLLWLPAGALALTGQTISTFLTYYKEDVSFINENTGRHLLPADLDIIDLNDNGRQQYTTSSDALYVTVTVNAAGIIESCDIRLLIPEGMVYGNSLHRDFITAGYHSYAFIMAMHVSAEPASRYLLVEEISTALEDNFGAYERKLGAYTITCTRVAGEGAVFLFTNSGLVTTEDIPVEEQETPPPLDDSERFG